MVYCLSLSLTLLCALAGKESHFPACYIMSYAHNGWFPLVVGSSLSREYSRFVGLHKSCFPFVLYSLVRVLKEIDNKEICLYWGVPQPALSASNHKSISFRSLNSLSQACRGIRLLFQSALMVWIGDSLPFIVLYSLSYAIFNGTY